MQLGVMGLGRMGGNIARRLDGHSCVVYDHAFADRLLSAMRKQFGGHIEAKGP